MNNRKVFQIGFNKCGTTSIFNLFKKNNIPSIHWDNGKLALKIRENIINNNDPIEGYKKFAAFTDMNHFSNYDSFQAHFYFKYFYNYYPDSYYILNIRDVDNWIKSRLKHGNFFKKNKSIYSIKSNNEMIKSWKNDWDEHIESVKFFFKYRNNLLIFDIEKDNPEKIKEFVKNDFNLDISYWGKYNAKKG